LLQPVTTAAPTDMTSAMSSVQGVVTTPTATTTVTTIASLRLLSAVAGDADSEITSSTATTTVTIFPESEIPTSTSSISTTVITTVTMTANAAADAADPALADAVNLTDNTTNTTTTTSPLPQLNGCSFQTSAGTESPWYGSTFGKLLTFTAANQSHIVSFNTNTSQLFNVNASSVMVIDKEYDSDIESTFADQDCLNDWQINASCVAGRWSYNGIIYEGCTTMQGEYPMAWCPGATCFFEDGLSTGSYNYTEAEDNPNCTYHSCASCSGLCKNGWLPKDTCVTGTWTNAGKEITGCTTEGMGEQGWCSNCTIYDVGLSTCDWSYCSPCTEATTTESPTTASPNITLMAEYQAAAAAAFAAGEKPPPPPSFNTQALYDDRAHVDKVSASHANIGVIAVVFAAALFVVAAVSMATRQQRQSTGALLLAATEEGCYEPELSSLE